jgi:hypothetical protein
MRSQQSFTHFITNASISDFDTFFCQASQESLNSIQRRSLHLFSSVNRSVALAALMRGKH